MKKNDITSTDRDLKRELAIKRKIGRLTFYGKDKHSYEAALRNFAKRSPELLPNEITRKKF